ncbi:NAD(P)-dependent dehydrogenase (short-subunit alcohol dehydrogenase family) [Allocatelliglobosispora scoriae]|uniref:NAD(P)-dependent dehydrogenase (Short-subunit alcohol dehydrogenase family) n=1 Tax=Allocatelliglobosispora scoriae TaxID=643052 RepID=A0A841C572_9ACTN|nr:SDR family oxidoreductase [Allocatelliglobosispora scoriae]MBB5874100.1 NAD(P)-dependent dehydrogenase (short-subunit alcohol dehydrogenase family) [Allocatelliglobosispora scoriae]
MPADTWFVTGASSGLGRALCERLLARGHRVAATARDPQTLTDLAPADARQWWTGRLDVTDHDQLRRCVDDAFAALGRIDVVVSNAGYGLFGAAEEVTDEQIDRQLRTNLVGPIQLARAVLPHLRAQGGGRIVQISSAAGQVALPNMSIYHASKWGVEGFFDSLGTEVAGFGIGVTIVEPGSAPTGFAARSRETGPALAAYAETPAGRARRAIEDGTVRQPGDVGLMAEAIIDSAAGEPAPRRLALGSDAYMIIRKSLRDRLSRLEAQQEQARSTDAAARNVA